MYSFDFEFVREAQGEETDDIVRVKLRKDDFLPTEKVVEEAEGEGREGALMELAVKLAKRVI